MLSSSSSAAALERGSWSSFSKVLLRGGAPSSSSFFPSRKRGRKWFRPRLVALTLLLAAVWGRESAEEQSQQLLQKEEPPSLASFPQPPYSFAHRGASGLLPEHTMQAYALAVEQGADFIECDAVFTKDCALVCRHDADLSRSTDAASKFAFKKATREIDGIIFSDGVFAADLTLAEVKTLRARQAKADSLGRTKEFDGLFPLVTLDEFAEFAAKIPNGKGRRWNETTSSSSLSSSSSSSSPPPLPLPRRVVGVHVEAKHPLWHSRTLPHCVSDPAAMVEAVAEVLQRHRFASRLGGKSESDFKTDPRWLRAPTFLQCFEPGALAEAHRRRGEGKNGNGGGVAEGVPFVQLVDHGGIAVPGGSEWWSSSNFEGKSKGKNLTFADLLTDAGLERVAGFAHAIGPSVAQVLDFPPPPREGKTDDGGSEEGVPAFSSLLPRASKKKLAVHAYTLRDDLINLDRFEKNTNGADREAEALYSGARVEGVFGDFPLTTARAARKEREEERERRRKRGSSISGLAPS